MCFARGICASVIFLSLAAFPLSQPLLAETGPLLPWREIERLLDAHPAREAALGQVGIAEGELREAKQWPNPELTVSAGNGRELEGSGERTIWDLELTIPVPWPGTYWNRIKAAKSGVAAARFDASAVRLDVYREIRGLYLMISRDQESIRMLRESERQLAALAEVSRVRVDQGDARPLELARVEGELEEFRIEIDRATGEATARRRQLDLWLGGKLPQEFTVEVDSVPAAAPLDIEEAAARAARDNPAVLAARARREAASYAASAERHAIVPEIGIGAFSGEELDTRNAGGLITVTVPLWGWNRARIARAKSEAERAAADADLSERRIKSSLLETHARARASWDAVARYRTEIIPRMRKALGDLETLYEIGECSLVDVLDARRALIRAQTGLSAVQYEYHIAMLDISVLIGGPDRE